MFNRFALLGFTLLVAACTQAPVAQKKEPPKPPEPVGAQKAFFQMYASARSWAADVAGFQMISIATKDMPGVKGKYPAWRAVFASPTRRATKNFVYSAVTEEGGLSKGITKESAEDRYEGSRGQNLDWPIQALKIDSDAAVETALAKGKGAEYSKKNPAIPITVMLEKIKKFGNPVYRIVWGTSVSNSSFSVYVDASTGVYLETVR
jgi:hypothetical protein